MLNCIAILDLGLNSVFLYANCTNGKNGILSTGRQKKLNSYWDLILGNFSTPTFVWL